MGMFLEDAEIVTLTGKKMKSHQIDALRKMGIPFFVNATGHPVVTRSAIEGGKNGADPVKKAWIPQVLRTA
jgi:hypothetical protein